MHIAICFLLIVVMFQGLARSADVWLENGQALRGVTYAKSTNGFGARLHVLPDKKLIDDWDNPSPPMIQDIERVSKGKTNYVVILFAGAGQNDKSAPDIRYDIDLLSPNGTKNRLATNAVGWEKLRIASPLNMEMGLTHAYICFLPTNSPGVYTVKAAVRDNVSRLALDLSREIRLED